MCYLHKQHMDQLESLHVCYFNKRHMDQPLESLHVCYFHKPHMDRPLESFHMCVLFHKQHMDPPLESLHVCSSTKTNTRLIACVFFLHPHMDQSVVIACVLFSTNHTWIH